MYNNLTERELKKLDYVLDLIKADIKRRDSHLLNNFSLEFVSVKSVQKVGFILVVLVNAKEFDNNVVMRYTYDLLNDTHLRLEAII